MLLKASGQVPHGGGVRLDPSSDGYALIRDWIRQGAPLDSSSAPQLVAFEVEPNRATIQRGGQQQLKAVARYSDGSFRDVTELALYESNDHSMAEVNQQGLVKVLDIAGNVAVMVRYQGKVAVYSASVPLGAPVENLPSPKNFIDEHVFANLQSLGIPPSPVCDDATFLRRVTLDIAGRLPTEDEATAFLAKNDEGKRDQVIDELLKSPGYADFFANKWTALLKNRRDNASDIVSNFAFHAWIRDGLLANKPYDQFVRELLAATGTVIGNPPVAWYKRVKEPKQQIEDVAQLFLGVRMQCAQCHHHPFERWSQDDYYALAAFFSQVGRKPSGTRDEDLIFHKRGIAAAPNMKTGVPVKPAALGDAVGQIAADEDPRLKLANWMSDHDNPFFAKSLVNRYWKHFFNRGLIEPEDDIRDTNPPTNPALLEALEKHFIDSGFDLKALVRVITQSRAYQLSAMPNEHNLVDRQNYSRYYPRRLQAEVLLDAIDYLAGTADGFCEPSRRDTSGGLARQQLQPFVASSCVCLDVLKAASVCECERVQSSSLAQSLHLLNSQEMKGKLANSSGRAERLAKEDKLPEAKIRELYLAAFSREPRSRELQTALDYLNESIVGADGKPVDPTRPTARSFRISSGP